MSKNKRSRKAIRIVLLSLLGLVLIGIAAIFIVNSTYHYDPIGESIQ